MDEEAAQVEHIRRLKSSSFLVVYVGLRGKEGVELFSKQAEELEESRTASQPRERWMKES